MSCSLATRINACVKKLGARVIRARGPEPRLLLLGESHDRHCANPRIFFDLLQPNYAFWESFPAGSTWTHAQSLALMGRLHEMYGSAQPDAESTAGELDEEDADYHNTVALKARSFMATIADFCRDNGVNASENRISSWSRINCQGFVMDALLLWHSQHRSMDFVGIDMPGVYIKLSRIIRPVPAILEMIQSRLDYALEKLTDLTPKQQQTYECLTECVDLLSGYVNDCYGPAPARATFVVNSVLPILDNNWPEKRMLHKVAKNLRDFWQVTLPARDEIMGKTIANTLRDARGIVILGRYHLRRTSPIYRHLEHKKIPYVAVDLVAKRK